PESGEKVRLRPESFADHYSQARLFYISQTAVEQGHLRDALIFELSKCENVDIRARMVAHLLNVDAGLAGDVAGGLGLTEMPAPAPAARPTRNDLPPSDALSILLNGPQDLRGQVMSVVASDGADAGVLGLLMERARAKGMVVKIVAPKVGGVIDSAGTLHP